MKTYKQFIGECQKLNEDPLTWTAGAVGSALVGGALKTAWDNVSGKTKRRKQEYDKLVKDLDYLKNKPAKVEYRPLWNIGQVSPDQLHKFVGPAKKN